MKRPIPFLVFVIILILTIKTFSQEIIIDTDFGIQPISIAKDNFGDIVIPCVINDTTNFWQSWIFKVTPDLNYSVVTIDDTLNDLFVENVLITQNNYILTNSIEGLQDGGIWFDQFVISVFDEDLNMISFKRYNMEHIYPAWNDVIVKFIQNADQRIFGFGIRGENYDFIAMEITEMGDTLRTKRINSLPGAELYSDVMESHSDSIALYAFVHGFENWTGLYKVLTLDTAFNYVYQNIVMPDPYNFLQSPKSNWINDSMYIGVGFLPWAPNDKELLVYKANANQNHELVGEPLFINRPDTADVPAKNIPTFVNPGYIYIGSENQSFPWTSISYRYMVLIIDENLNVLGMKSYGKPGYNYNMYVMQATDDMGCILAGTVYDIANSPTYDWDLFIHKIMPEDIVQLAEKTEDPDDSDYFVFPNPGSDILNINSNRKNILLSIYNMSGQLMIEQELYESFSKHIDVSMLPSGNYRLIFTDKEGHMENIIWLKI